MLKRLMWLSFLCLMFCLLLFVAAEDGGEAAPVPQKALVFYALPAQAKVEANEAKPELAAPERIHPVLSEQPAESRLIPCYKAEDRPFHLQNFFAFHYSSEAG